MANDIKKVKLSDNNVEYTKSINSNFSELEDKKVDKVEGKGLSEVDFTSAKDTKLTGIEAGAEVNVIEIVKVNNTALTPDSNRAVDITVPTTVAELTDEADYAKVSAVNSGLATKVDKVSTASKVYGTDAQGEQTTYDISSFGQVDTVNSVSPTAGTKNVVLDADDIKMDKTDGTSNTIKDTVEGIDTRLGTAETKLSGIESGAEVNTIVGVQVNGTDLTPDAERKVNVVIPASAEYTMVEQGTPETGFAKTYYLTKDNVQVGAKINIPKDLVISSGEVKTVTTADVPYEGAVVGDKYIDLTLNDSSADHIYIPVNDLVDAYTAGDGIAISSANVVSAVVDSSNANGLSVGANGLALAEATTSTAGAMSSADKTKLNGIETGAEVNVIDTVKVNGTALTPDAEKAVDVSVPTKIFSKMRIGATDIEAGSTTDTFEIEAGNNITVTAGTKKVTIDAVLPSSSYIQTISFTSSDEGWGAIDTDGNYTLTVACAGTPIAVQKIATSGGYETVMAGLRGNGTNAYVVTDTKFDGKIIYYA